MPEDYQDASWDVYRTSERPEFEQSFDPNERVDEDGGIEEDD